MYYSKCSKLALLFLENLVLTKNEKLKEIYPRSGHY